MTEIGYFLSSEEHPGSTLVDTARRAEDAGFTRVWLSDHFHPWTDSQGHSPFVWCVIGGIASTTQLRLTTAVTCPTVRIHPVIVAQAAATAAEMMPGRFTLGVGSGEALNEHVLGEHWPTAPVRLEMLHEAIEIIRELWKGEEVDWRGRHYTVESARIYTRPDTPPPIVISAFGPAAMELVVDLGDGWATTSPDQELMRTFRARGRGPATAGIKVCWGPDEAEARKLAHEKWRSSGVPGELSQVLPTPAHFEQASELVTEDQIAAKIACGPDVETHLAALEPYFEAGFDEIYISQVGPDQAGFMDFWQKELESAVAEIAETGKVGKAGETRETGEIAGRSDR
jgi:G6PDH family F420-dependent oxidoreductase